MQSYGLCTHSKKSISPMGGITLIDPRKITPLLSNMTVDSKLAKGQLRQLNVLYTIYRNRGGVDPNAEG